MGMGFWLDWAVVWVGEGVWGAARRGGEEEEEGGDCECCCSIIRVEELVG